MIPIEYQDMYNMATIFISLLIGWTSKHYADTYFSGKRKITQIRKLLDTVDEALKDDKVSEEEFAQIFNDVKAMIQK